MELFLVLSTPRPAEPAAVDALASVLAQAANAVPGLAGAERSTWQSPSRRTHGARVGHAPERAGGLARAWSDGRRWQVLDGFPIVRDAAPPRTGPIALDAPDGRFALCDVADDEVALTCDRMGSYAAYARRLPGGAVALGNSPAALAALPPRALTDPEALEDFLVAGWIFGGSSPWAGVERLPPGRSTATGGVLRPSSGRLVDPALEAAARPVHRDVEAGADLLRGTLAAVGRDARGPVELGLSGGRDSRVVLAAAVAAGLRPHTYTLALAEDPQFPDTGDVVAARRVAAELGLDHEVRVTTTDVDRSERWLRAVTGGVSAMDATPSTVEPRGRTPVVLTGAAVELGWLTHGLALTTAPAETAIRGSVAAWIHRFPGHLGTAGAYGRTLARGMRGPREWHEAGLPSALLAEAFFAFERTANWAAPTHFAYAPFFDAVSPGWSADLLPILWSLDARDRELDRWRRGMIRALCPEIERLPFSGGSPLWPDDARGGSYMLRGEKRDRVRRFVRSRALGSGVAKVPAQLAAFRALQEDVRRAVAEDGRMAAVVDRRYAERLARTPVRRLDPRSQQRVVRAAHVARVLREAP